MTRPVVLATVNGRAVTLRPVRGCDVLDVADLVQRAGIDDARTSRGNVIVGLSRLPDAEAAAEVRGWIIQRSKRRSA